MNLLILEVRNIMKIFIKQIVMFISACFICSCTPRMTAYFWNGHYSLNKTAERDKRRLEEFYASESQQQRALRRKNHAICEAESIDKYSNETIWQDQNSFKRGLLYKQCMSDKGSPIP